MAKRPNKPVKIFLSYSRNDKKFVGELKETFELAGMIVFLAHEDIAPSLEWQDTIMNNLKTCDVFVPIISKKFSQSSWTDQESGIALAYNKAILPANLGKLPYGFLAKYQAVRGKRGYSQRLAFELLTGLTRQKSVRNRLRESIILALRKSRNYDDSGSICELLFHLSPFSRRQMNLILRTAIRNSQVYGSRSAIMPLERIISANRKHANIVFLEKFQRKM